MIIDARIGPKADPRAAIKGARGQLVNLDTGQPIRWPIWANLATGEFQACRVDPVEAKRLGIPFWSIRYSGKARLRFIPAETLPAKKTNDVSPQQVSENAPQPGLKPRRGGNRISAYEALFANRRCEHYACDRPAAWKTAEEVPVSPLADANGQQFERAKTVAVRFWCDWHYQWPQIVHPDGSKSDIDTVKARPD